MSESTRSVVRAGYVLALLVIPGALGLFAKDTLDLNRAMHALPEWRWGGLVDVEFTGAMAEALADRVGARRSARIANAHLSRWLGDDLSTDVIVGRDGWVFLGESLRLMALPSEPIRQRRAVNRLKELVTGRNREFRMVVAPTKATIYPEQLDSVERAHWNTLVAPKIARFKEVMRARPVAGFIDLGLALTAAARGTDELLYEPLGTHWVDRGAVEVAQLLVESLRPGLWDSARVVVDGTEETASDVLRIAGLTESASFAALRVVVPGYATVETSNEWAGGGSIRTYTSSRTPEEEPAAELLPPMILFFDSYGPKLTGLITPFFERAVTVDYAATGSPRLPGILDESAIVLFEIAERYFFLTSHEVPSAHWETLGPLLEGANWYTEPTSAVTP